MADDPSPPAPRAPPQPTPRRARRLTAGGRLGERDLAVLVLAAEHHFVLAVHTRTLLGVSGPTATARLTRLRRHGLLRYERRLAGAGAYQITRRGLEAIGSSLPAPGKLDLGRYDHELGMAWVWLAAERGAFGRLSGIASERFMRSEDRRRDDRQDRFGVHLPGLGRYGGERRHYPDLMLDTASGHRVAVELELTGKGRRRRDEILGGYALDARIDAVLYLVEDERTGRAVERAARKAGIGARVHVQMVRFTAGSGAIGRGRVAEQTPAGRPGSERAQPGRGRGASSASLGAER